MKKTIGILMMVLMCLFTASCEKVDEEDVMTFEKELEMLQEFLAANNITTPPTATGLYFVLISEGDPGPLAQNGDLVTVHYSGRLLTGYVFDQTEPNAPFTFQLGVDPVIPGWQQGIAMMKAGDTAWLIIPSTLAYGPQGSPGAIPPYSTLIFEVQLLSIQQPEESS